MTVMQPSKGGNGLAQSFLTNTATQAPQQSLPQIQAPQPLLPKGPMPMPVSQGPFFGALYPGPDMPPQGAASANVPRTIEKLFPSQVGYVEMQNPDYRKPASNGGR